MPRRSPCRYRRRVASTTACCASPRTTRCWSSSERALAKKPVRDVLADDDFVLVGRPGPGVRPRRRRRRRSPTSPARSFRTDTSASRRPKGSVTFIQKPTEEKADFIAAVERAFLEAFGVPFSYVRRAREHGGAERPRDPGLRRGPDLLPSRAGGAARLDPRQPRVLGVVARSRRRCAASWPATSTAMAPTPRNRAAAGSRSASPQRSRKCSTASRSPACASASFRRSRTTATTGRSRSWTRSRRSSPSPSASTPKSRRVSTNRAASACGVCSTTSPST